MQIKTQISQESGKRLEKVIKDYGFRSRFEVAKALLTVYIKAYDPREEDEVLCENLKDILIQETDYKIKH
mgnify:CR=1 FL=1|jgi:metal-responsive CopG/Arc/MetJ family transcriptional regulator